jgi:hypothetical protein
MHMVAEYRTHAEKCRELANSMTTPVDHQIFRLDGSGLGKARGLTQIGP